MESAIDYSNWKQEKINSKVYYMSPIVNPKHGKVIRKLTTEFDIYLRGKTCEVYSDNIVVYLDDEKNNYVVPDVSILCDPNKFKSTGYHGIPSLVIEVISPSNIKRDRIDKFKLYEHFGIQEYWLVDYKSESIEQYVLINGHYQLIDVLTLIGDTEYTEVLTQAEREAYTTIITPTIFNDLEIDIRKIFK